MLVSGLGVRHGGRQDLWTGRDTDRPLRVVGKWNRFGAVRYIPRRLKTQIFYILPTTRRLERCLETFCRPLFS